MTLSATSERPVALLLFNLGGPETLVLFRDDAKRAGIVDYRRTEALNTHPLFIEALAGLVERHVMETACPT